MYVTCTDHLYLFTAVNILTQITSTWNTVISVFQYYIEYCTLCIIIRILLQYMYGYHVHVVYIAMYVFYIVQYNHIHVYVSEPCNE